MNGTEALKRFEEEYMDKVLGFCYQKVNNRENAEDLSVEITLEVLRAIRSGKEIENLGAFVWSVSNHTFFKWLRARKYGSTVYLDDLFASLENIEDEYIRRETENILHREVALLSEKYRKAVVLYYFEGKSCSEIGALLGKSGGTVKWWLHNARNSIKEGFDAMREYGEKSYNPGTLTVSCQGDAGADNEPMSCAKRKLPQNILLAAYQEPLTIEQLCMELGTPAAYVEDEVENLVSNQLMKEVSYGKYQTDFVILPWGEPKDQTSIAIKIYETCFPGYFDALTAFLERHKALLSGGKFNMAGFSWDRLLWVYLHIVTEYAVDRFRVEECGIVPYRDMPDRPNGGRWIALGFNNCSFGCGNPEQGWKEYIAWQGPLHKTAKSFVQGYFHYWSGLSGDVFFEIPDDVFVLCRDIILGTVSTRDLTEEQKYLFSIALEKKLFLKEGEKFRQNYYFLPRKEMEQLYRTAMEFYPTALEFLQRAYGMVLEENEASIPKRLRWQMGNFLSNNLGIFVTGSLYEGMRKNMLSVPGENDREWLSLFASE